MTNMNNQAPIVPAIDLDKLEALARAATPGPWIAAAWTCHAPTTIKSAGGAVAIAETTGFGRDSDECAVDASFIATANPAAVLELIALARRAEPSASSGAGQRAAESAETRMGAGSQPLFTVGTPSVAHVPVDISLDQRCRRVVQENDPSPAVGSDDGGYGARGLQDALALVFTIVTHMVKRDDCGDEFLNGMAYGVAIFCNAHKAQGIGSAPIEVHSRLDLAIISWAQICGDMCSPRSPADPRKRANAMLEAIEELRAALAGVYAPIVRDKWEAVRAEQDSSKKRDNNAEPGKDEPCAGLS